MTRYDRRGGDTKGMFTRAETVFVERVYMITGVERVLIRKKHRIKSHPIIHDPTSKGLSKVSEIRERTR